VSVELIEEAIGFHRAGDLARAAQAYRAVLEREPGNADALHLLGVVAHQCGDHAQAAALIEQAIARRPGAPSFYSNLGEALRAAGREEEAVDAYSTAIDLDASFAAAHANKGAALLSLGRTGEAIGCLRAVLRLDPSFIEAHMNLGSALKDEKRFDEAAACFARAVELNPGLVEAHVNLGNALNATGEAERARRHYEQAIRLDPMRRAIHMNLALLLTEEERYEGARNAFQRAFELNHAPATVPVAPACQHSTGASPTVRVARFALVNGAEHIEHLVERGKVDERYLQVSQAYRSVLAELPAGPDTGFVTLSQQHARRIAPYLDKVIHFADAPRLAGPAVNPDLDFRGIEDAYLASRVPVVFFDDFLTDRAWRSLLDFCQQSTIFFGQAPGGFLSSSVGAGFQCSLLFQIAQELKRRFPRLLAAQSIGNMWVYRYPSRGEGVRAHTDEGSVTFNFWITPSEANLDPHRGGLEVYTREQPLEWDFERLNLDKDDPATQREIHDFLRDSDTVNVAYRGNRAVLFHSNLFHRSDAFHFRDDYSGRRMNITLLFGRRGTDIRLRYV